MPLAAPAVKDLALPAKRRERLMMAVAALALLGLAAGFWLANGARLFNAMMASAFSLCF